METEARTIGRFGFVTSTGTKSCWQVLTARQMESGGPSARKRMTNTFTPGPTPKTVRAANGTVLTVPDGWILLPPGDAALTRRVKAACEHWVVQGKRGRKVFSRGIWAVATTIDRIRAELG